MFLREAQGVYKYGSKRVFLKIEKSIVNVKGHKQPLTQIFVRVGGGFMQIDDFIEQYEQQEVEKRQVKPSSTKATWEGTVSRNTFNSSVLSQKNKGPGLETKAMN